MRLRTHLAGLAILALVAMPSAYGDDPKSTDSEQGLTGMSLEELTRLTVSSVSRRDQQLSRVAAAAYIITDDDIRRSGVTSIPELLRRVPGLEVAHIDSNKWAVSARGFNNRFANKMLVLIDGRSVYNNEYSGVYWDQNDVLLADIERIEVIRGPGATMWGANAVNGVINVITKKAKATQGGLVSMQGGGDEAGAMAIRYGGSKGERLHYRVFSKAFERRRLVAGDGSAANDEWGTIRGGARVDWEPNERDRFSFSGDLYSGRGNQTVNKTFEGPYGVFEPDKVNYSGGYAMTRWERTLKSSDIAVQTNYSNERRNEWIAAGTMQVLDFDFQHHIHLNRRNDLVWGGGYRLMHDSLTGSTLPLNPRSRTDRLSSIFLQNDVTLVPDKLVVTLGSKFQHNSYTGLEVQPGARLLRSPTRRQSWWASVARAVRTPSRRDHDLDISFDIPAPSPIPVELVLKGNRDFKSETMIAYEAGYRAQLSRRVSLDVAGFVNDYDRLEGTVAGALRVETEGRFRIIYPMSFANVGSGRTHGVETSLTWNVNSRWRLQAGHAWAEARLEGPDDDLGRTYQSVTWLTPRNTLSAHSAFDVTRRLSFDASLYYVSKIPDRTIPKYVRADIRAAWKIGEAGEFSAGVQNAQSPNHLEFPVEEYSLNSAVPRTAYVRLLWTF